MNNNTSKHMSNRSLEVSHGIAGEIINPKYDTKNRILCNYHDEKIHKSRFFRGIARAVNVSK